MNTTRVTNPLVKLEDVRLSFPSLWTARKDPTDTDPNKKPKFEGTFILDKKRNAKAIKAMEAAIAEVKKSPVLKGRKPNKVCLRPGDDTDQRAEMEGYGPDVYTVAARNHRRPAVVDRDLTPLTEEDNRPYAGCYVNAMVEVYPHSHPKSGPGIAASLRSVQYLRKGEAFGAAPVDASKDFEALEPEDESGVM